MRPSKELLLRALALTGWGLVFCCKEGKIIPDQDLTVHISDQGKAFLGVTVLDLKLLVPFYPLIREGAQISEAAKENAKRFERHEGLSKEFREMSYAAEKAALTLDFTQGKSFKILKNEAKKRAVLRKKTADVVDSMKFLSEPHGANPKPIRNSRRMV